MAPRVESKLEMLIRASHSRFCGFEKLGFDVRRRFSPQLCYSLLEIGGSVSEKVQNTGVFLLYCGWEFGRGGAAFGATPYPSS
jgi:hypothetical protein